MIFVVASIIAVVGGLAFAIWFLFEVIEADSIIGKILGGIFSLFIAAICGFVFVLASVGIGNIFIPKETKLVSETSVSLRALDAGSETSGRFFVGSGYINEKKVLEYISESEDGGMRVSTAPANMSVLYERDAETPKLIIRHYEQVNGWLAPEAVHSFDNYEFVIPKGSVKDSYAVSVGEQ